jgi:two-component system, NtrC family, nitrogen regulation sensor histidine kinase NtrY
VTTPARRRMAHETRVFLYALAAGAPALALALVLLATSPAGARVFWTVAFVIVVAWFGFALAVRAAVVRPLQTLSNMLAALREGDYSIRARGSDATTPLGLAFLELNALSDTLRRQRLDAIEATALLRRVMEEIDVAIFAFDPDQRLRLVNRGAEVLLDLPAERALGRDAPSLGLAEALAGDTPRLLELAFPSRTGRWELRRAVYRRDGRPHQLLVLSDLSRPLREEERLAWQRLVRVLSHEINNSLAPIRSIAGSLRDRAKRERALAGTPLAAEVDDGLGVIEGRAESLGRFLQSYARLTRLPRPTPAPFDVAPWAKRVAGLETRVAATLDPGPDATVTADAGQLEAALINLLRNAADAALETGGAVTLGWRIDDDWIELQVTDEGPGVADTANLFVPFFTTKRDGTGIGLALSRQIAEAHGGTLALENRADRLGAIARLRIPLRDVPAA